MNYGTTAPNSELAQLGWAFSLLCVLPVVALGAIAYLRYRRSRLRPGMALHSLAYRGLGLGFVLGAFVALPLPFDITMIVASALLGLGTAWLAWNAREGLSGVLMSVATALGGILSVVAGQYLVEALFSVRLIAGTPMETFALLWGVFGFPAAVSAAIAVATKTMAPADEQTVYDKPSGHQQGPSSPRRSRPMQTLCKQSVHSPR